MVSVELCTLHFQKKMDEDFLLSNALFADGAAAVLVESEGQEKSLEMQFERKLSGSSLKYWNTK